MSDPTERQSVVDLRPQISFRFDPADTRAAPNYLPLTQKANQMVFVLGPNTIPNGPYHKVER